MTLIIGKGSIEEKIKHEKETRRMIRSQEDKIGSGKQFYKSKGPERGDYKFCDTTGQMLRDMKKYPKDKEKISKEYHEFMESGRKYGSSNRR